MTPEPPGGAPGNSVVWREGGHRLDREDSIVRFEVADLNRVLTRSAADSALYGQVLVRARHPADWDALVVSCFAVTDESPPIRLAEQTGFRQYRVAPAGTLLEAGYLLWPTETFVAGVPDARNEVHYDLVVALGPNLVPPDMTAPTPAARRAARATLRPLFDALPDVLGPLLDLPPGNDTGRTMDDEEE